jgi:hypothetical protein
MSVFLGTSGYVEIQRNSNDQALVTSLDPNDINIIRRRFSVDFARGSLITGDKVTIATTDKSPLQLVNGHQDPSGNYFPDWRGYVHIDDVGGIRLYNEFGPSLTGEITNSLQLIKPSSSVQISIQSRDDDYNRLARIMQYELTTSRDQINLDVLGDEFRSFYDAGIISGQGALECFWEHRQDLGEDNNQAGLPPEFSSYLARLIVRLKQGAGFRSRFFIYAESGKPAVWYEADCIVTNVGLNVEPEQVVKTQIQFATTGAVELHQGLPDAYLLQEDSSRILQEDGSPILLEEFD